MAETMGSVYDSPVRRMRLVPEAHHRQIAPPYLNVMKDPAQLTSALIRGTDRHILPTTQG